MLLCKASHGGSDFPGTEDKGGGLSQAGNGAPTPVMAGPLHIPAHLGMSALAHLRKMNL